MRPFHRSPRRDLLVASLALALGTAACGPDDAPGIGGGGNVGNERARTPPLDDEDRRRALRDRLREQLGARYDTPLPTATLEDLRVGAELWPRACLGCHGEDGRGRRALSQMLPVPPGDLTDPVRWSYLSERAKLSIVEEGSPGTPMFGWEGVLTRSEMRAVIAHLSTLVKRRKEPYR